MGGCATKPRESNCGPEKSAIPEPTLNKVESKETASQENKDGGEIQKEEPLVDLSEPNPQASKPGDASSESKTATEDLVSAVGKPSDVDQVTAKQTEKTAEAGSQTVEQIKEGPGEVVADVGKKDAETHKSDDAGKEQLLNSQSSEEKVNSSVVSA